MQQFRIADIENLTGIKAHTLRIWEQRYGLLKPKRKESSHRVYDNEDLRALLHVAFLYHNGWKISRIAELNEAEREHQMRSATVLEGETFPHVARLMEVAMGFNEQAFTGLMNSLIEDMGFEAAVRKVFYPFLERIGLLWCTGNIIPAQEHFSSYLIQNRIVAETDSLQHLSQPNLLLFAPKNEWHELSLLFMNYLLRKGGTPTLYLGPGMSIQDVKTVVTATGIRNLLVHLVTNLSGMPPDDFVESMIRELPGCRLFLSGVGFSGLQRTFTAATVLPNDRAIQEFIDHPPI